LYAAIPVRCAGKKIVAEGEEVLALLHGLLATVSAKMTFEAMLAVFSNVLRSSVYKSLQNLVWSTPSHPVDKKVATGMESPGKTALG
jgi:hypothetical protein